MRIVLAWLIGVCLIARIVNAVDDVLLGAPDPAVIGVPGEGVYGFATGSGMRILHSNNLLEWTPKGRVFKTAVPAWAKQAIPETRGIWAPDISFFKGMYYLYYSVSSFGSQRSAIGLCVNTTLDPQAPDYHWEDRGMVLESFPDRDDFNAIDPARFNDHDGRCYLTWGSYWSGIKLMELDPVSGKPMPRASVISIAARGPESRPGAIEAPFIIRRNRSYYLFVSWDFCCDGANSTYKIMVGKSGKVTGPYLDIHGTPLSQGGGTLVLAGHDRWRGPGHNSVLQTKQGDWLIHHVYDAENLKAARILQVRRMYWLSDWPVAGEPVKEATPQDEIIGTWDHSVDYRNNRSVRIEANGTVTAGKTKGSWKRRDRRLAFAWPKGSEPDEFWVDALILEPGNRSYIGRNQNGAIIRGVRR